jgi:hypothetical protein
MGRHRGQGIYLPQKRKPRNVSGPAWWVDQNNNRADFYGHIADREVERQLPAEQVEARGLEKQRGIARAEQDARADSAGHPVAKDR